jgi:hypothetical protein
MIIHKKILAEHEVIDDIVCDICQKSCKNDYTYECIELSTTWGYGTDNDGEKWEAHVCHRCVIKHLDGLINFTKTTY